MCYAFEPHNILFIMVLISHVYALSLNDMSLTFVIYFIEYIVIDIKWLLYAYWII